MLVLSRRQDDKIIVGNNVTITILKIRGNTVRIGIDAPREIDVVRGELTEQRQPQATGATVEFRSNCAGDESAGPTLRVVATEPALPESPNDPGHGLHRHIAQMEMPIISNEQPNS